MLGALKFENKPLRTRWYLSATRYTTILPRTHFPKNSGRKIVVQLIFSRFSI